MVIPNASIISVLPDSGVSVLARREPGRRRTPLRVVAGHRHARSRHQEPPRAGGRSRSRCRRRAVARIDRAHRRLGQVVPIIPSVTQILYSRILCLVRSEPGWFNLTDPAADDRSDKSFERRARAISSRSSAFSRFRQRSLPVASRSAASDRQADHRCRTGRSQRA